MGVCLKMLCKPLKPLVLLIIIPMKNGYFIGSIPDFQTNPWDDADWDGDFWFEHGDVLSMKKLGTFAQILLMKHDETWGV